MKEFTKRDENFVCENCGKPVEKLVYTSRDHCPHCLCSKHVDIMPGDRANDCHGLLRPIQVELDSKKGYVIVYKCERCGQLHRNKAAEDDNTELLIQLTVNKG
jgi:hypothetical protein